MVGTNDEAGQLRGWADLATTQEHQFAQLGSWGAAGWCNEHLRLIGKEGSLVSLGRQLALKSADLRREGVSEAELTQCAEHVNSEAHFSFQK